MKDGEIIGKGSHTDNHHGVNVLSYYQGQRFGNVTPKLVK